MAAEDDMIHFLDCGAGLLLPSNNTVNVQLLPDKLHPNTAGYRILAACIGPVVDNLIACEFDLNSHTQDVHSAILSFTMALEQFLLACSGRVGVNILSAKCHVCDSLFLLHALNCVVCFEQGAQPQTTRCCRTSLTATPQYAMVTTA